MARKKNLDQPILPQIDDDVLTAKSNRISQIRDTLCHGSNVEFAQRLNSSTNYTSSLCNGQKPIGEKILNKILSVFPEVDKVWLFFGDGNMLHTDSVVQSTVNGDNLNNGSIKNTSSPEDAARYDRLISLLEKEHEERSRLLAIIENLTNK